MPIIGNEGHIARLGVDTYFQERIWRAWGLDIFAGVTQPADRVARVAQFIRDHELRDVYINPKARHGVARETWGAAFERGYRTPVAASAPVSEELPQILRSAAADSMRPASISSEDVPPYQRHSETSRAAAFEAMPTVNALQAKVLAHIVSRGGATDDEIQHALGMNPSTERPRRVELVEYGFVRDSGKRRKTQTNRLAVVWEIARLPVAAQQDWLANGARA